MWLYEYLSWGMVRVLGFGEDVLVFFSCFEGAGLNFVVLGFWCVCLCVFKSRSNLICPC